jgi:hypothetical protein
MGTKIGSRCPPRNAQIYRSQRRNTLRSCFLHCKLSTVSGERCVPQLHRRPSYHEAVFMPGLRYVIVRWLPVLLPVVLGCAEVSQGFVPRCKIKDWSCFDAHKGLFFQSPSFASLQLISFAKMMLATFVTEQRPGSSSSNAAGKGKKAISGIDPDVGGWCYVG